jgi:hypothetical protein
MSWVATSIIGSAAIGAWASNRAADKQADATREGIAAQQRLTGPYAEAGHRSIAGVEDFVNQGANFSDTQAFKDIVNMSKSGRGLGGGPAAGRNAGSFGTALTDYYATNFRPQRLNELGFLTRIGANAAAGQATNEGNLYNTLGGAQAGGALGVGNSISGGLSDFAFLQLLKQNPNGLPPGFRT